MLGKAACVWPGVFGLRHQAEADGNNSLCKLSRSNGQCAPAACRRSLELFCRVWGNRDRVKCYLKELQIMGFVVLITAVDTVENLGGACRCAEVACSQDV